MIIKINKFGSRSVTYVLKRIEKLAMANGNSALIRRELSDAVGNRISVDVLNNTVGYLGKAGLIVTEIDEHQIDEDIEATRIWMSERGWAKCFDIRQRRVERLRSFAQSVFCAVLAFILAKIF